MLMKKLYFLAILSGLLIPSFGYAVESSVRQQGFESFAEKDGKIIFSCKAQCVYILWGYNRQFDYIDTRISAKGQGKIWYGFVNGQQIIPGEITPFANGEQRFSFAKLSFLSQIPDGLSVVMIVDGDIAGDVSSEMKQNTFSESMVSGWNDFWTFDSFRPYSINLLYGPRIFGTSVNGTFYMLFIFFSLIALFVLFLRGKEKKFLATVCIIGGALWIVYDMRMTLELNGYYIKDYKEYISQESGVRSFRDRGNFYDFMNFTQKTLGEVNVWNKKTVSFFTDNEWPFYGSATYFLLPSILEKSKKDVDILVFYGYKDALATGDNLIVWWEVIGTGTIVHFSKQAFIFIRN